MLAGAADHFATSGGTIGSFNALREDFTALRSDDRTFQSREERFSRVDDGFTEMRGKLD